VEIAGVAVGLLTDRSRAKNRPQFRPKLIAPSFDKSQ